MIETKLRAMAHNRSRIFLTRRKRSRTGFVVTGPDGKLERVRTYRGALNVLLVRLRVHRQEMWAVRITP